MNAIKEYIADFGNGGLDASTTHWVLISVIAVAEVSLAVGIFIESPQKKGCREWFGLGLVFLGCIVSAVCTVLLLIFDEGISRKQQFAIDVTTDQLGDTRSQLSKAGLTIGTLTASLDEMRSRISEAEQDIKELRAGRMPPAVTLPSVSTGRYVLTDDAKRIIRETVQSGAVVSIIPFMKNLEPFATALGETFASVSGVQVAVGHDNFIMNGQTGLIVQYDHDNSVSVSVFNALAKAGLNPIAGPATPGTSIVFIKVAPPP